MTMIRGHLQLMLDLETLATEHDAVVCEVGMVLFSLSWAPNKAQQRRELTAHIHREELYRLNMTDQRHRKINVDTLIWMGNTPGRMAGLAAAAREGMTVKDFLAVSHEEEMWGGTRIWCRGTHFDITILDSLIREHQPMPPWRYNVPRDIRTLEDVCEDLNIPHKIGQANHDALHDCRAQLTHLVSMMDELQLRTGYKDPFSKETNEQA